MNLDDDPRDLELPRRWREWSYSGRAAFLKTNLSRGDLFRAIVLEVDLEDRDPENVSANSRFTKDDLAAIALRLGLYRP